MSENVDYRILEHLKAIRGDLENVKGDLRDIKTRLLTMESYQAAIFNRQPVPSRPT